MGVVAATKVAPGVVAEAVAALGVVATDAAAVGVAGVAAGDAMAAVLPRAVAAGEGESGAMVVWRPVVWRPAERRLSAPVACGRLALGLPCATRRTWVSARRRARVVVPTSTRSAAVGLAGTVAGTTRTVWHAMVAWRCRESSSWR